MRRHLIVIALLLLGGATVNVAVAWACALWSRVGNEELIKPVPPSVVAWFHSYSPVDVALPRDSDVRQRRGFGLKLRHMSDWVPQTGTERTAYVVVRSWRATAGAPVGCLDGALWEVYDTENVTRGVSKSFALELPERLGPFQVWTIHYGGVIPLRPLWPGFAFNTIFYAAILWLLIPGPFVLRRVIRRRKGLCPACGYDLGHAQHDTCPECGVA